MGYTDNEDTIFAPATVPGTGAVCVVRLSGPRAIEIAGKVVVCGLDGAKGYTIRFGRVFDADGSLLDEVLAGVFRAPHSYTGEDSVEISCHSSSYIVSELSLLLVAAGARPAEPGEFTKRAYLNGKMDLTQAEAVADLIEARGAAAHRIAVSQLRGGFSAELREMRAELLKAVSLMELELDFSEENVEFADRGELDSLLGRVIDRVDRLAGSFRLGNAIKNGVPTAIIGAANAGKSTLLNALLGEDRAIVSPVRGTTRDTVEELLNIDGILFRLIDTAGLRDTDEEVERLGIERTRRKAAEAEIVLGMVDGSLPEEGITAGIRAVTDLVDTSRQRVFLLVNKCDLIPGTWGQNDNNFSGKTAAESYEQACNKKVNELYSYVSLIVDKEIKPYFISAKTGEGLDTLRTDLAAYEKSRIDNTESTLVTNVRHLEALRSASEALHSARAGLRAGTPTDLLAQDTREAVSALGSITGEITSADILASIFSRFCIGK